ncbi:MAG: hypothetical protein ACPLW7_02195 [Minisyncoccia bacterium]
MNKKGFAPLIIVLIVALLAAGSITGYTYFKNKQQGKVATKPAECLTTTTTEYFPRVGGNCSFDSYKGTCEVISIEQYTETDFPGRVGYTVKASFKLNKSEQIQNSWFSLRNPEIVTFSFPPANNTKAINAKACIDKYKIQKKSILPCTLNIETIGTCTPVIFRLDNIGEECLYY